MCADFYYYLNRQGLQGRDGARGEKGEPGNTPTFRTGVNTPTVYTLIVDSGDGVTFETGNLKYPMRDDGGDYLRYDRDDATVVLGNPNYADLQGNVGEVKLASIEDHEGGTAEDTDAVSYELFKSNNEDLDSRMDGIDGEIERVDGRVTREIQDRDDADTALSDRIYLLDTNKANKTDVYTKTQTDNLLAGKANTQHTHTLSQITNAGTFAAKNNLDYNSSELTNKPVLGNLASKNTVDYQTEVTNKPTIPTVGDGTITITQGGVTKGTFTTNQSGNSTIELDAGGGGNTYTEGDGITIDQNNEISVNVDNDTIVIEGNSLKANIPDVSNFVTDTQLANTLEAYPTNTALSNLVDYVTETSQTRRYIPLTAAQVTSENPVIGGPEVTVDTVDTGASYEITVKPKYTGSGYSFYSFGLGFKYLQDPTKFVALKGSELNIVSLPIVGGHTLTWRIYGISESLGYIIATQSSATAGIYFDDNTGRFVIPNDVYVINISVTLQVDPSETFDTTDTLLYCVARYNSEEGYSYLVDESTVTTTKAVVANTAVDGTTIGVDNNGQLTYIGTTGDTLPSQTGNSGKFLTTDGSTTSWATVSQPDMTQYYTKTQTDSLLDGKINTTAPTTPIVYQAASGEVTYQNVNESTMVGSGKGVYTNFDGVNRTTIVGTENGSSSFLSSSDNYLLNNSVLTYIETELVNGINFTCRSYDDNRHYTYILGHYETDIFIGDAIIGQKSTSYTYISIYIVPTGSIYFNTSNTFSSKTFSFYLNGQTLTISGQSYGVADSLNKTITSEEATILNSVTHIRVYNNDQNSSTLPLSEIKVVNPTTATPVTDGDATARQALFTNGINIFEVVQESLYLKYDSNTLGVNSSNELTVPIATTSNKGLVQPDGSTITINNGVISAASSTPSNMVTTDTTQTISSNKTFTYIGGITIGRADNTDSYFKTNNIQYGLIEMADYRYPNFFKRFRVDASSLAFNGTDNGSGFDIARRNITGEGYKWRIEAGDGLYLGGDYSVVKVHQDGQSGYSLAVNTDMLDGTTLTYDSTTNKISAAGSTPIRKTITQASANISESSGAVTVTDADVTTSTMVTLYPSDTTTETWLANNLASNIITEGTGSFTFTINGTLPSTFSMYYIIQEVN